MHKKNLNIKSNLSPQLPLAGSGVVVGWILPLRQLDCPIIPGLNLANIGHITNRVSI